MKKIRFFSTRTLETAPLIKQRATTYQYFICGNLEQQIDNGSGFSCRIDANYALDVQTTGIWTQRVKGFLTIMLKPPKSGTN